MCASGTADHTSLHHSSAVKLLIYVLTIYYAYANEYHGMGRVFDGLHAFAHICLSLVCIWNILHEYIGNKLMKYASFTHSNAKVFKFEHIKLTYGKCL